MPARRPYASRGVPRRATTRRSARRLPRGPLLVCSALLLVLGATFAFNPFASSTRLNSLASPMQPVATPGDPTNPASAPQQLADATSNAGPRPAALQRQWDSTTTDGIAADPVLVSRLDQALTGVDGHVGVAVKDLGTGRGAVLNGNLELQSASLYKLPVLFTVFDLGLNMSEELTISEEALSYDTGSMELSAGETLSVAEALERMVTLSDNTSAILLGSRVGAARINANLAALGMDTTHYSLERMTTSALDIATLLQLIADGKAVSPAASADMLHLLLRQRVNDRLPRLVPDSVQVAHKTGNLPGVVNDAGILYGTKSTVVVAALVSDTTDEVSAATAIANIGQVANAYFDSQPEVADHPTVLPAPARPIPPVWRESHPPTATPIPAPRVVATLSVAIPTLAATLSGQATVESSPTVRGTLAAPTAAAVATSQAAPAAVPAATATAVPAVPTSPPRPTVAPPTATATPLPPQPTKPPPATAVPTAKPAAPTATPPPNRH